MIHLGASTDETPEQVIERAYHFFGPDSIGLRVLRRAPGFIYFAGSGGHVQVTANVADAETEEKRGTPAGKTDVDVQSMQWEKQAQDFLAYLK